jgi:serpin B
MQGHFSMMYKAGSDYSVAELPYEGQQLRMTIVLPAADKFDSVRGQVSGAWLDDAVSDLAQTVLEVQLPKFEMTTDSVSLTQGLQALGMKLAFTPQADFSGITTDTALSISDVLQKAFISVDQNGTEAAAATGVGGLATSAAPTLTPFIVDHSFLFFIRDASGAVLFSGQVVDPSL